MPSRRTFIHACHCDERSDAAIRILNGTDKRDGFPRFLGRSRRAARPLAAVCWQCNQSKTIFRIAAALRRAGVSPPYGFFGHGTVGAALQCNQSEPVFRIAAALRRAGVSPPYGFFGRGTVGAALRLGIVPVCITKKVPTFRLRLSCVGVTYLPGQSPSKYCRRRCA